jgi:hypothetical protein
MNKKARVIAFYLPQFHPIPENDEWWGKGFTEWTNVKKARPLFKGHYQPRIPADLGYYDLRVPEVRERQAEMAREAGIEGFCYWHYWFGNGKQLLERPFKEVLETGKPDIPFCLGWANHSWTNKTWTVERKTMKKGMLMEQFYSEEDYVTHFYSLLPAFKDKRYIRVDNKPLFVVFKPYGIVNPSRFITIWNELSLQNGINGIHFVGMYQTPKYTSIINKILDCFHTIDETNQYNNILNMGFDAVCPTGEYRSQLKINKPLFMYTRIRRKINSPVVCKYNYNDIIKYYFAKEDRWENVYPVVMPNWDRTPRNGKAANIWHGSTPELFKKHICNAVEIIKHKQEEHKILFLKSWNEWGEGNYMEPDTVFGSMYLESLKQVLNTENC